MTLTLDLTETLPARGGASSSRPRCKFKYYPNPDEVVFCDNPAVWALTGPCCSFETPVCDDCIKKLTPCGFWQCNHCGRRTNAPTQVTLRRL